MVAKLLLRDLLQPGGNFVAGAAPCQAPHVTHVLEIDSAFSTVHAPCTLLLMIYNVQPIGSRRLLMKNNVQPFGSQQSNAANLKP